MQPEGRDIATAFLQTPSILEALPVGITVQDRTGNLVYANAAGADLLGFSSGQEVSNSAPGEILSRFEVTTEEGESLAAADLPGRRALRGEEPTEVVLRVRNLLTGEESWRAVTATPIRDERGEVLFAVNIFRDITAEKRAYLRLTAKDTVTRILWESPTLKEATPRIMEAVCQAFHWDLGQMWGVDEAENVLRFVEGWRAPGIDVEPFERVSRGMTFEPGVGLPGRVWASRKAAWIPDVQEDENFPRGPTAAKVGLHGAFGFPVIRGGRLRGVMEFLSLAVRAPDQDILHLMANLGIQIAAYIDRREAEDQQRFLIGASEELSKSVGWEETLERVTRLAVPRLADSCVVYIRNDETGEIARVALEDRSVERLAERLQEYRLDPEAAEGVPKVIRTGRAEFRPDADPALLAADVDDPAALAAELEAMAPRSWMCVPLTARGRTFGAVSFVTSVSRRRFHEQDLTLALDLARRAAIEVDNAILYREGEEAQRRLAFLAEASRLLSGSLDYDRTLKRISELAVPQLADWCVVDILEEDGTLTAVNITHSDPAKVEMARDLRRRYAPDPHASRGSYQVIRTGEPELYREITDEMLQESAVDEEHLRLLRELQLRSALVVPLVARGKTLGTLSLALAESERSYGEREMAMAVDLATRAAVAADNARLYRFRSHIARTLQRSLLPPVLPPIQGMELTARYRPAEEGADIGGDFYDIIQLAEGEWGLVIGDVCGKGVEAAALTGLARHSIRATLRHGSDGVAAITVLNEEMRRQTVHPDFCTLAYAHLTQEDGRVEATVVCAGHPPPLVVRASGKVERAGDPGTLVGIVEDIDLHPRSLSLGPGDTLFMYTDGLVEGMTGDESAEVLLRGFLAQSAGSDVETLAAAVDREVSDRTPVARDDAAFLVARVVPT